MIVFLSPIFPSNSKLEAEAEAGLPFSLQPQQKLSFYLVVNRPPCSLPGAGLL